MNRLFVFLVFFCSYAIILVHGGRISVTLPLGMATNDNKFQVIISLGGTQKWSGDIGILGTVLSSNLAVSNGYEVKLKKGNAEATKTVDITSSSTISIKEVKDLDHTLTLKGFSVPISAKNFGVTIQKVEVYAAGSLQYTVQRVPLVDLLITEIDVYSVKYASLTVKIYEGDWTETPYIYEITTDGSDNSLTKTLPHCRINVYSPDQSFAPNPFETVKFQITGGNAFHNRQISALFDSIGRHVFPGTYSLVVKDGDVGKTISSTLVCTDSSNVIDVYLADHTCKAIVDTTPIDFGAINFYSGADYAGTDIRIVNNDCTTNYFLLVGKTYYITYSKVNFPNLITTQVPSTMVCSTGGTTINLNDIVVTLTINYPDTYDFHPNAIDVINNGKVYDYEYAVGSDDDDESGTSDVFYLIETTNLYTIKMTDAKNGYQADIATINANDGEPRTVNIQTSDYLCEFTITPQSDFKHDHYGFKASNQLLRYRNDSSASLKYWILPTNDLDVYIKNHNVTIQAVDGGSCTAGGAISPSFTPCSNTIIGGSGLSVDRIWVYRNGELFQSYANDNEIYSYDDGTWQIYASANGQPYESEISSSFNCGGDEDVICDIQLYFDGYSFTKIEAIANYDNVATKAVAYSKSSAIVNEHKFSVLPNAKYGIYGTASNGDVFAIGEGVACAGGADKMLNMSCKIDFTLHIDSELTPYGYGKCLYPADSKQSCYKVDDLFDSVTAASSPSNARSEFSKCVVKVCNAELDGSVTNCVVEKKPKEYCTYKSSSKEVCFKRARPNANLKAKQIRLFEVEYKFTDITCATVVLGTAKVAIPNNQYTFQSGVKDARNICE